MNTDELFISAHKLPNPLSKQEVYELLEKIKQGDEKAKEKLVEHNIRLVLYQVANRFKTVDYDKKELVSIGNIGLMKAITTFDTSKKIEFATYATKCVNNEILMFLRKLKKYNNVESLDRTIYHDKDGNELKIEDILSDDIDIEGEYTDNEIYRIIREVVKDLPDRDREIIMLYFGFYNDIIHTEREIADKLSISQSYVSKLIRKIVKRLAIQLKQKGLIELKLGQVKNDKINNKNQGGNKMSRRLQTIYEYFNSYTKEQVDTTLKKLTEAEKALITLRYGEDLNNPVSGKLNKEERIKVYNLLSKMKKLLANPDKEIRPRNKRVVSPEIVPAPLSEQTQNIVPVEHSEKEDLTEKIPTEFTETNKELDAKSIAENSSMTLITKEDYLKVLELLRTPSFNEIISVYSPKEAIIISLKLGYVDGKCFSTLAISEFLGIEQQEIIDITRKVLLSYKEKVNQIIDSAIQIAIEEPKIKFKS